MTLQAINLTGPVRYGPAFFRDNGSLDTILDATSEYVAIVFNVTNSGTIDRLHFLLSSLTANGDGLRVRLETVDLATGLPSGTLVAGSSEVTVTTAAAGWNRSPAGLNAAVTAGDLVAIKLMSPATGTTFQGTVRSGRYPTWTTEECSLYAVQAVPTAAKYVTNAIMVAMALEYNDGTTPLQHGFSPISNVGSQNASTGVTYDTHGNVFRLPFRCSVSGITAVMAVGSETGDFVAELLDASNNVLASHARDATTLRNSSGLQFQSLRFASPLTLEANTTYKVVVRATTSSALSLVIATVDTATGGERLYEAAGFDAVDWVWVRRAVSGSTWSQVNGNSASIGLIISHIDDGGNAYSGLTLTVTP